jgi:hypothetical protein
MKSWLFLLLACAACTAGDDTASGSRARCAEGGALNDCPDSARTPQAACWRLVDCGAISISSADPANNFDWGDCVDRIENSISVAQTLIINCIAASSCDALKVQGSPDDPNRDQMACFHLGGR